MKMEVRGSKSQRRLQRNNWDCIRLGGEGTRGESEEEQSLTITSVIRTTIDKLFSSLSEYFTKYFTAKLLQKVNFSQNLDIGRGWDTGEGGDHQLRNCTRS